MFCLRKNVNKQKLKRVPYIFALTPDQLPFKGGRYVGVGGSPERDISSLPAFGPGGGQISRVVHVSARAAFGVSAEKCGFVQEGHTFIEKVWFRARGAHFFRKNNF